VLFSNFSSLLQLAPSCTLIRLGCKLTVPFLYSLNIAPLSVAINSFGVSHQQYTDATEIYIAVSRADVSDKVDLLYKIVPPPHHIRALRHILDSLPDEVVKIVACSVIGSGLEYCNVLLSGISPALKDLQWLPKLPLLGKLFNRFNILSRSKQQFWYTR